MPYVKNWFSNMLPLDKPFTWIDGLQYHTVEHFYQCMKVDNDGTLDNRIAMLAMSPYACKKHIRSLKWNETRRDKLEVMEIALRYKFAPGTSWYTKLMATGNEEIADWVASIEAGESLKPAEPVSMIPLEKEKVLAACQS